MSKFPSTGASIFTTMSKMANEYGAINLSQGFPNFPVDAALTEIAARVAGENFNQYMPSIGYLPLLENIARLILGSYGRNTEVEEILVTAGATQGIFTAIQALVNRADEVIILDPAYDCYDAPVILAGAVPVHVHLGSDFLPDWDAIASAVTRKTKMIVINNPHNPSGRVWDETDFARLEHLLEKYPEILVLSDEVYEFITFGKPHISVNTRKNLIQKSIVVSSFGKSFHITGWKIGYLVAPAPLMAEIRKVHQFLVFSVNSLAQAAIAEYLTIVDVSKLGDFYREKRDYFAGLLHGSRFNLLPCEGSYFQIASYQNIDHAGDLEFTRRLVAESGVAAIPLSPFYADKTDNRLIRFCFAKDDATLKAAALRLKTL